MRGAYIRGGGGLYLERGGALVHVSGLIHGGTYIQGGAYIRRFTEYI